MTNLVVKDGIVWKRLDNWGLETATVGECAAEIERLKGESAWQTKEIDQQVDEIARLRAALTHIAYGTGPYTVTTTALRALEGASNEPGGSPDKLFTEADLLEIMEPCVNCRVALMQLRRERSKPRESDYDFSTPGDRAMYEQALADWRSGQKSGVTRGPCAVCGTTDDHHGFGCPVG